MKTIQYKGEEYRLFSLADNRFMIINLGEACWLLATDTETLTLIKRHKTEIEAKTNIVLIKG